MPHNKSPITKCLAIMAILYNISSASIASGLPQKKDKEIEFQSIHVFALGFVGLAGHISKEEELYRSILMERSSTTIFWNTINSEDATIESKLYAACGLREKSPKLFRKAVSIITNQGKVASVLRADILKKENATDLINRIDTYGCNNLPKKRKSQ